MIAGISVPTPRRASPLRLLEPKCRVEGIHGDDTSLPKVKTSIRVESEARIVHIETGARRLGTARVELGVECSRCKHVSEYVDFALERICPTCRITSTHGSISAIDFDPKQGPPATVVASESVFEWLLLDASVDPLRAAMEGSLLAAAYEAYYLTTVNLSREANVGENFLEAWTHGPLATFKATVERAGMA